MVIPGTGSRNIRLLSIDRLAFQYTQKTRGDGSAFLLHKIPGRQINRTGYQCITG